MDTEAPLDPGPDPGRRGPAQLAAGRGTAPQVAAPGGRGYPPLGDHHDPTGDRVALAATRALVTVTSRAEAVQTVLERQAAATGEPLPGGADQHEQALRAVRWLARSTAAAVACDDPTIVRDALTWLVTVRVTRGIPATPVIDSCFFLAEAVETDMPAASLALRQEAQRAHADL